MSLKSKLFGKFVYCPQCKGPVKSLTFPNVNECQNCSAKFSLNYHWQILTCPSCSIGCLIPEGKVMGTTYYAHCDKCSYGANMGPDYVLGGRSTDDIIPSSEYNILDTIGNNYKNRFSGPIPYRTLLRIYSYNLYDMNDKSKLTSLISTANA